MLIQCDSCSAKFDATGKRPGAVFRCPRCKEGQVAVPNDAVDGDSSPADPVVAATTPTPAAATPRPTRRSAGTAGGAARPARAGAGAKRGARTARKERPEKAKGGLSPAMMGIGAAVIVAVAVVGYLTVGGGGKGDVTDANGSPSNDSTASAGKSPSASPTEEYEKRITSLAEADAAGRLDLAHWCEDNGLKKEAAALKKEALILDPSLAALRTEMGYALYDGPATPWQGRWFDEADRRAAKEKERFYTRDLPHPPTKDDVFTRNCEELKKTMLGEFSEDRWLYSFGEAEMPTPFMVLIERKDGDVGEYRDAYANTLRTLREAFYLRYQEQFGLEKVVKPIRVIMFDSRNSYSSHRSNYPEQNYADPTYIGGYYQPWAQQVITWRQSRWENVLFHEGTHLFVHYAFSGEGFDTSTQSPWFQEGFAEYFGGYKKVQTVVDGETKTYYKLGYFLPGRYLSYQQLKLTNELLTVRQLVDVNSFQFEEAKKNQPEPNATAIVQNIYAQGWAFIMYLNYAEGVKEKKVFDGYFDDEVKGAGHWESLGDRLGLKSPEDWDKLNDDFREWADNELPKINKLDGAN